MEAHRVRRIVIPLIVGSVALLILLVFAFGRRPAPSPPPPAVPTEVAPVETAEAPVEVEAEVEGPPEVTEPDGVEEFVDLPEIVAPADPGAVVALDGLRAVPPVEVDPSRDPQTIGNLNPSLAPMLIEFNRNGAGIARITLSEHWETAAAKRQADAHYNALAERDPSPPPLPDESLRYLLKEQQPLDGVIVPIFATHSVVVADPETGDSERVSLWSWAETGAGRFEITIVNQDDEPLLHITRQFTLGTTGDITLEQSVENISGRALDLVWRQYGPGDLELERARYFDSRRFRFGYVRGAIPGGTVLSDDTKLVLPRADAVRKYDRQENYHLWPTRRSQDRNYVLSWFASTNRYFALAIHPLLDEQGRGSRLFTDITEDILYQTTSTRAEDAHVFTTLVSPAHRVEPGETLSLDVGIYAGPMNRHVLGTEESYVALGMEQLILYMMSTWCAICTFQWLAHFLMWFLSFLHDWVLFDWGLAIIALVCVVRLILHPITKKSQINIMRFGKKMQKMKPDIEKIQKKYKEDPKRLQQEQMRLMREHGVNPLQAVGCLPMFLQFPIWIALYAMLYFAFDLRHQPAFFGAFQSFAGWPFLADLSSGDHFFGEFAEPVRLFAWFTITGINVLPILMGFVLYVHQKYMTPPPSATMSPEQIQQQKIMRVMIVLMLPVVLYPAPAGLTLYIITSSIIGIIESRYVRAHVDQMDLEEPPKETTPRKEKSKKPKDAQTRAYVDALERAKQKAAAKKKGPPPSWKKRK